MEEATLTPPTIAEAIEVHADCDRRIGALESERNDAREKLGHMLGRLDSFKAQVKEVAIEQMREGRWCLGGMNEQLERLGIEQYMPRYVVSMTVDLVMEVEAEDEEDAISTARDDLRVTSEDENFLDVSDVAIRSVQEDTER